MQDKNYPITLELLESHRACISGRDWFSKCRETDLTKGVEKLLTEERHSWAAWLVQKLMTDKQLRQYVIFSAESVLDIYEKRYPEDKRPREAIAAAKEYLADSSELIREKLMTARSAAYAAADAAEAAAYAADTVAAAYTAAYAAADAYARLQTKEKIIRYGLSLILEASNEKN